MRLELNLSARSESTCNATVLEFKPSFFPWPNRDSVGVSGWYIWQSVFVGLDEAINTPDALEQEFSFFMQSAKAIESAGHKSPLPEGYAFSTKQANSFSAWAFDNVRLSAWQYKGKDVFLMNHCLDKPGQSRSLCGSPETLFRLGNNEQQELWLALREISDAIAQIKCEFLGEQTPSACKAQSIDSLPKGFGGDSTGFAQELARDNDLDEQERLERLTGSFDPEVLAALRHYQTLDLEVCDSKLSENNAAAKPTTEPIATKQASPRQRVIHQRKKPDPTRNEALNSGPMPWPVKPSKH